MKFSKLKNLHIYFFYLFLFSIPFQTRKVFLTEYSFYSGAFTEYATFFVYLSDILLFITLFLWLISSKGLIKRFDFNKINIKETSEKRKLCHSCPVSMHGINSTRNPVFNSKYNFLKYDFGSFLEFFKAKNNQIWKYLLFFVLILGVNLIFKRDYLEISFFQFLKLSEVILLSLYVYFNLNRAKWLSNSLLILSISGFVQGIIAIQQFTCQGSVFDNSPVLRKITGESLIGVDIPGVANFVFEGQKIVRSYGTLPHPNILGGFLIFTTLITIFLYLESKNGYLSSKITSFWLFGQYNNTKSNISQGVIRSLFWIIVIFVQISALLLTFSRISWLGFVLVLAVSCLLYAVYSLIVSRETIEENFFFSNSDSLSNDIQNLKNSPLERGGRGADGVCEESQDYNINSDTIVSRETITSKIMNYYRKILNLIIRFKELAVICILLIYLIISNLSIVQARIGGDLFDNGSLPGNYAISDRSFYNNVSRETISNNFLFGSGLGTYIFQIDGYFEKNNIKQELEPWQYQPAHNIYFLIASEIGLIGLLTFLLFIGYAISGSIRQILKPVSSLYKDVIQIVSRETIEYNSSPDKDSLSNNIQNLKNSPLERGGRGADGVCEKSQDYNINSDTIVSRETIFNKKLNYFLLAILISFLFIGLFDHYFWTLQQGRLMFWLVLGLMLTNCKNK